MNATFGATSTKLANVLYLTDFSPTSDTAIKYVKEIAEHFGSKVFLAHIIESPEYRFVPPEGWAVVEHASEEAAKRQLHAVDARLGDIPHQAILRHGEVWKAAAELIKTHDIQLVVVGTHGRTGLRRFLMGSVAEEIFRQASCPVLTVGPGASKDTMRGLQFTRIVLATDFGEASLAAVPHALSLAGEYGAKLTLLHIARLPMNSVEGMEHLRAETERRLRALLLKEIISGCSVDVAVRFGDPQEEILRFVREKKADLIVLGLKRTSEYLAMVTHLGRATAHAIVCGAPCPVLAVKG